MHLPKHAVNCPINMVNLQQINIYEGKKKKMKIPHAEACHYMILFG